MTESLNSPVVGEDPSLKKSVEPGMALCLSGGGYRAMLFHLGTLWRLNELGYLSKLKRISSVSGGSITAGMLGLAWKKLGFGASGVAANLDAAVVRPIRKLASTTIDADAIVGGIFLPGTISSKIAADYDKHLYEGATLQDLPDDPPRFVINATNIQTGALFRFMKPAIRDWRVGEIPKPRVSLALAVAASSAFPPVLSPARLEFKPSEWTPPDGTQDLHSEPYTTEVVLSDGGVYDNLGLETAWKRYDTILVSDAGGKMAPDPEPKKDWARHSLRVLSLVDNQVRNLRKRQVIGSFEAGERKGAYWGIRTDIADYGLPDPLPCPHERTMKLAEIPTRLKKLEDSLQERVINWGYAVCDAAIRRHVEPTAAKPTFPYPSAGI